MSVVDIKAIEAVRLQQDKEDAEKKRAAELEVLFARFEEEGKIVVDTDEANPEAPPRYVVARFTTDRFKAIEIVEQLEMAAEFDRVKQLCFTNGMIDSLRMARREVVKLGPLKSEKALKVLDFLINYLVTEQAKI